MPASIAFDSSGNLTVTKFEGPAALALPVESVAVPKTACLPGYYAPTEGGVGVGEPPKEVMPRGLPLQGCPGVARPSRVVVRPGRVCRLVWSLEETAVWVGVDGLDNRDLLQAGIAEANFAPATTHTPSYAPSSGLSGVTCLARPQVYAWWEDLPSAPVRVALPVKVGDSVTVSIFNMSPGWWALAVHDLTARQSFLLAQPYGGPKTSVEWVVEAPQVLGLPRDPVPFSAVHFRDLGAQGEVRDLERFNLSSGASFTSRPDVVAGTEQLMRSGFAVHLALGKV